MKYKNIIITAILYIVFIFYILLLIKILFISRVSSGDLNTLKRSVNIIPFSGIWEYFTSTETDVKRFMPANVFGNIIIFVPLGVYLPLFIKMKKSVSYFVFIFISSLFIELFQFIFNIGIADVDDLILNCIGGFLGLLIYKLFSKLLKTEYKVKTIIAVLSFTAGLPVILYMLFVLRFNF